MDCINCGKELNTEELGYLEVTCNDCEMQISYYDKDETTVATNKIKEAWMELIGNTEERDAFGNVTISGIDYDAFTKIIKAI